MTTIKPTTIPSKRLAASINAASASLQLNNILGWNGVDLAASDFGTVLYAVLRNDNNTLMELISLDPSTIADDSITILKRGLKFDGDLTTEVTANKLTWVKNETIVELGADTPQLFQWLKEYIDEASFAGGVNATSDTKGIVEIATSAEIDTDSATGSTGASIATTPDQLANSKYGTRLPTAAQKSALAGTGTPGSGNKFVTEDYSLFTPPGIIAPYIGYTAPTAWLLCNGSAVSRSTYAALFAAMCPSGTFTVTIASPAVFTKTAHGYLAGEKLHFTTTGGLPSGLAVNTDYYVISTGLATDTFRVSLTPEGPAVNTSGSQSGTHTVYRSAFGKGDGSTTFNLPDLRGRVPVGLGVTTTTLSIDSANVTLASPSVFTIPADSELYQGQAVVLSTTGAVPTGFTAGNTYYVIRATQNATTITLASSLANANAGTGVNGSGSQSGIHTLTYTPVSSRTVLGRNGGEEIHGLSTTELAAHTHPPSTAQFQLNGGGSSAAGGSGSNYAFSSATGPAGGNIPHNNMPPFTNLNYIIKI